MQSQQQYILRNNAACVESVTPSLLYPESLGQQPIFHKLHQSPDNKENRRNQEIRGRDLCFESLQHIS